jgi:hypothetical protein
MVPKENVAKKPHLQVPTIGLQKRKQPAQTCRMELADWQR